MKKISGENFAQELTALLDPEQLTAVKALRGPVAILAGAGTGKTRAITHRIAYAVRSGTVAAENILAVTFTAKAAGEMRSRLADLGVYGVQAQTFHAAALMQLRYFWPEAIGGNLPQLVDTKHGLVAMAAQRLGLGTGRELIRDLAAEIEWSKVSLIPPADYEQRAKEQLRALPGGVHISQMARLIELYEEVKSERGLIDFEDVILVLIGILADRKDLAAVVRRRYQYFVVDEFQDVSPMQYRLLQLWLGTNTDLCVVGDVSQTIYSFAGANSRFLAEFGQNFKNSVHLTLDRNYRSTPQITDLANQIIKQDDAAGTVLLRAQREVGKQITWTSCADDQEEAQMIAGQIAQALKQGRSAKDFAILYRVNAQSQAFEAALQEVGIPYVLAGAERFFQRKVVREAMAALRGAARGPQELPLGQAVEGVLFSLGWRQKAPDLQGAARERWESLNTILELAKDVEEKRGADLAQFVKELEQRASYDHNPEIAAVTLTTLHAAKGLEWPVVFLAGMSEGMMPISYAKSPALIAEERRLLYVGITRARDELYISYARGRRERGERKASRFFAGLWPQELSASTLKRRRALASEESFLTEHAEDLDLFNELVAWRKEVAQEHQARPFQVFSDTVLRQIAIEKPTSLAALQQIKGVGQTKLVHFGNDVVSVVKNYLR